MAAFKRILYIFLLIPLIWLLSGFYSVDQNEIAVPVLFGRPGTGVGAGIHYSLPYPLSRIHIVDIKKTENIIIGFGNLDYDGLGGDSLSGTIIRYTGNSRETVFMDKNVFSRQYMTGDDNIVAIEMEIMYNIVNPEQWFFQYEDPAALIKSEAEKLLFNTMAARRIDDILVRDPRLESNLLTALQEELDSLQCGTALSAVTFRSVSLPVRNVEEAYRDVKSAEDDRTRRIEEAGREAREILSEGKTEARQIRDNAIISAAEIRNRAIWESEVFDKMLVSRDADSQFEYRLYMEKMETLLGRGEEYLINPLESLETVLIDRKDE